MKLAWFAAFLMLGWVLTGCDRPIPPGAKPAIPQMAHDGYIWQRKWTPGVRQCALSAPANGIGEIVFLALEIAVQPGGRAIQAAVFDPDWEALKGAPGGVGAGIRIGGYSGPFEPAGPAVEGIVLQAQSVLARAREHGVKIKELQLDFDCSVKNLEGYRVWVKAIKRGLENAGVKVEMTALPSWLGATEFLPLVKECDAYVLQVHALAFEPDGAPVICDAGKARGWIKQAMAMGVPFRVALPTYGYALAYDAGGKRIGMEADAGYRGGANVAKRVEIATDTTAMASLVKELAQMDGTVMKGVIWYRLPVEEDYRNWRWLTLKEVMAGRAPEPILKVEMRPGDGGDGMLFDVVLKNQGTGDAWLSSAKVVFAGADRVGAADAVSGFLLARQGGRLEFQGGPGKVRPGEEKLVGWVRFKTEASKEAPPYVEFK